MKVQEIRVKTTEDLKKELDAARMELFTLRLKHATRQLESPMEMRKTKKKIARILTVLRERELGAMPELGA